MTRLEVILQAFQKPLRADLQETYGVDLPVLFSQRRYKHLLALIDGLPASSRYVEAMYADEEWRQAIEANSPDTPTAPPLSTWTAEVNLLAQVVDSLAVITQTLVAVNGGKARKVKPVTRPLSKTKQAEFTEAQQSLLDDFLPSGETTK